MIGHGFWGGPGWALLGFLVMVGFWVLVIMLIVGLVRGGGARRGGSLLRYGSSRNGMREGRSIATSSWSAAASCWAKLPRPRPSPHPMNRRRLKALNPWE